MRVKTWSPERSSPLTTQDPAYAEPLTIWAFPLLGCSCSWLGHHVMIQPTPFLRPVDVNVSYLELWSASLHLSPLPWGLRSGVWTHCSEQVCPRVQGGRCPWPVTVTVHVLETFRFPAERLQSPRGLTFPPARPSLSQEAGHGVPGSRHTPVSSLPVSPGPDRHLRPRAVGSCCPVLSPSCTDFRFKPNPEGFICPAVPLILCCPAPCLVFLGGALRSIRCPSSGSPTSHLVALACAVARRTTRVPAGVLPSGPEVCFSLAPEKRKPGAFPL